jgi:hypothetical protein
MIDPVSMIFTSAALAVVGVVARVSDNRALERQRAYEVAQKNQAKELQRRQVIQQEIAADFELRRSLHAAQWGYLQQAEAIERQANLQTFLDDWVRDNRVRIR